MTSWRAINGLFLCTTILEGLAFGHISAYTPLYLAELGLTPAEVSSWTGILYAVMMGTAFPLAPFWGSIAERYSRRAVILRGQYLATIAYLMLAFAPNVWWVVLSRILLGLTFGSVAVIIATQALLTPRQHVGTAIATVQTAMPIAASIGPPMGAALIEWVGLRGMFMIDAGLSLTAGLLLTFLLPEPPKTPSKASVLARTGQTLGLIWRRPALRWNFISLFLTVGSRAVVEVYLPVRITEIADDPAPMIGLVLGVSGVITAIATFGAGRLVGEDGGIRWFVPAMVLAGLATFGIAVVPSLWLLAAFAWIRAVPYAAANTLLTTHLTRVVPRAEQTVVLSITPMPRNTAMFFVPIFAAAIAPFGVGLALGIGGVAYLISAGTGWLAKLTTPAETAEIRRTLEVERQAAMPAPDTEAREPLREAR
jgi:DHA1 family multidrug resistance protein-like MFS transporter